LLPYFVVSFLNVLEFLALVRIMLLMRERDPEKYNAE